MTIEEKREAIRQHCVSRVFCTGCPLRPFAPSGRSCYLDDDSANIERRYAAITGTAPSLREEILRAAKEAVCGQRHDDYGSVENNFKLICDLWSTYLGHEIKPVDVAMCMALLKIARIKTGKGTRDSFIDLAGYAACGAEVAE